MLESVFVGSIVGVFFIMRGFQIFAGCTKHLYTKLEYNRTAPVFKSDEYSDEQCCICLDPLDETQIIRNLPCEHKFHKQCIDLWVLKKNSCPLCNKNVLQNSNSK